MKSDKSSSLLKEAKKYEELTFLAHRVEKAPEDSKKWEQLAEYAKEIGQDSLGEKLLAHSKTLKPVIKEDWIFWSNKALEYMEEGRTREALNAIRRAKELGMPVPENLPGLSEIMATHPDDPVIQKYGKLGMRLEGINDRIDSGDISVPEAIEERWMLESEVMSRFYPERIEEVRPTISMLENSDDAEELLEKIKADMDDSESHGKLGRFLVTGGHPREAVRFLLMATKNDPENYEHWAWLAHSYFEIKRPDLAADALRVAKSRGFSLDFDSDLKRELDS